MRRPRPVVRALAAAITIVLLLDARAVRTHVGAPTSAPSELRTLALDAAKTVEGLRRLRFRHRVPIEVLPSAEFDRVLRRGPAGSSGGPGAVPLFVALGLIDPSVDLAGSGRAISSEVAGLYDAVGHRIVVRAGLDPVTLRHVLVHELTHALDDQHFGLARATETFVSDESLTTLRAVFEGDARWVELHGSPPLPDRGAATAPPAVPPALLAYVAYPYEAGYAFVDRLRARGGTRLLNDAFAHPPTSSAQILQPELYPASGKSVEVRKPKPAGPVIDRGVFGELFVYLTLRSSVASAPALGAARQWAGGRYVIYEKETKVCIRATLETTTTGTSSVLDGLRQWAARHPAATVVATGRLLELANCEAMPAATSN